MATNADTQEDDDSEMIELLLAVSALLNYIRKPGIGHVIDVLADKVKEEILKERLHVKRLKGENASLRIWLDYSKECHLKKVKESELHQKVTEDAIRQKKLLQLKFESAIEHSMSYETTSQLLQIQVEKLDRKCRDLERENVKITDRYERIAQTILKEKDDQLSELRDMLNQTRKESQGKYNIWYELISPLQAKVQRLQEDLEERDIKINGLDDMLKQKHQQNQRLKMQEKEIQLSDKSKTQKIQNLEDQIRQRDLKFRELEIMSNKKSVELEEVRKILADRVRMETPDQMLEYRNEKRKTRKMVDDKDAENRKDDTSDKKQIKHLKSKLEEHERYLNELQDKFNKHKIEMNKISKRKQTLESVREEEHHNLKKLQVRENDLIRINTSLKEKIQVLETRLKQSNTKVSDLEEQLESMSNEITVGNRWHVSKVNGKDRQLSELKDQLKQSFNQLHEENTKHGEMIKTLEEEKMRLVEQIEDSALQIRGLEEMLNNKNNEITSLQEKVYQIAELNFQLQLALDRSRDKKLQVRENDLIRINTSLKEKIQLLETRLKQSNTKVSDLEEQLESMSHEITVGNRHYENKGNGKDMQLSELNDQLKQVFSQLHEEKTKHGEMITTLEKERMRHLEQIEHSTLKIRNLEKMLKDKNTKIVNRNDKLETSLQEKVYHISKLNDQLQQASEELQDKEAKVNANVESREKELKKKDAEINELRDEVKTLQETEAKMDETLISLRRTIRDLEADINHRNLVVNNLRIETANENKQLLTKVDEQDTQLVQQKKQLEQTLNIVQDKETECSKLLEKNQSLVEELNSCQLKVNSLENCLDSLNTEMKDARENIVKQKDNQISELRGRLQHALKKLGDKEAEMRKMDSSQKNIETTEKVRTSEEKEEKIANLKDQLRHTLTKLHDTETELDEIKTRSTDKSSTTTYLSDRNRPTKLAERCVDLYENQWTDALNILGKFRETEESVFEVLLHILQDAMKFCETMANKQMEELGCVLKFSSKHDKKVEAISGRNPLKECRQAMASDAVENLHEMYMSHLTQSTEETFRLAALEVSSFSKECLEICWFMVVQEPPVVFAPLVKKGSSFNTELYKPYERSGTHVDYVVWPPMLLHEGGPVLAKGVAQGYIKA